MRKNTGPSKDKPAIDLDHIKAELAKRAEAPRRFNAALGIAAKHYQNHRQEGAALAVRAALDFVKRSLWVEYLRAPLHEAADVLENGIDPDRRATYLGALKVIKTVDGEQSDGVDINEEDPWFTKAVQDKIYGSVIVELQLRRGVKLKDALKSVVGDDSKAASKLKDFRNNMKRSDTPKGARKLYYELIQDLELPPGRAADMADKALRLYHARLGKES